MPPVPASNTRTSPRPLRSATSMSFLATTTPTPSSLRLRLPHPMIVSMTASAASKTPQDTRPVRFDRELELREIAVTAIALVTHARRAVLFQTRNRVRHERVCADAGDPELRRVVIVANLPKLVRHRVDFLARVGALAPAGLEAAREQVAETLADHRVLGCVHAVLRAIKCAITGTTSPLPPAP